MAIDFTVEEGVAVLSLNRAPANAYNMQMLRDLADAVRRVREDSAVRVAVVRSALPKFFCTGADISTLQDSDRAAFANFLSVAHEAVDMITRTPKLFIAAISGHCIGGGLEIALSCDFRFASAGKYRLGLAEVNLGLSPGMGGTQRLPRLIGKGKATEWILTGEMYTAQDALRLGLVSQLVPQDQVLKAAKDLARKIAAKSAVAIGQALKAIEEGIDKPLVEGLALEAKMFTAVAQSEDSREGVKAYLEKRQPQFKDR